jgi:hypothetical protein
MEEDRHSAQMNTPATPPVDFIEHGREDGDTRRRVQDSRNPKPEQIHNDLHLKGVTP